MLILLNAVVVPLGTTCPSTIPSRPIMKETIKTPVKDNLAILYYIIFSDRTIQTAMITATRGLPSIL